MGNVMDMRQIGVLEQVGSAGTSLGKGNGKVKKRSNGITE